MSASDIIAFSNEQQAAVFGHALKDPALWHRLDLLGVTKEWFLEARLSAAFEIVKNHRETLSRPPNAAELVQHWTNKTQNKGEAQRTVAWIQEQAQALAMDVLHIKLLEWARSRVIASHLIDGAKKYNAGDHVEARRSAHEASMVLRRLEKETGALDSFTPANVRVRKIDEMIDARSARKLRFGIPFFDEALSGIFLNDVILVGARSGAGKTDVARIIAETNARDKARVAFFALEAFEGEIEARVMYAHMARQYQEDHPGENAVLDYGDWIDGEKEIRSLLRPYHDEAYREFDENLSTLQTYYRAKGHFGTPDFEREASIVGESVDLIVLDHIHYVDLDGKDENRELTQLMKTVSDVSRQIGVPFIIVAHLRKPTGGSGRVSMVPGMDEYHGSSGLSKIATGAIMLAGANVTDLDATAVGHATLQRVVKSRTHGGRAMKHVGLAYFDRRESSYGSTYSLGELNYGGTKWTPITKAPPRWAKHALLKDPGEIKSE